jgi:tRNA nucleotidyltransferase/poly(A) polymerase
MPKLFEVGGCVRDSLIGVHTNDIDFTFVLDDLTKTVDDGFAEMTKFLTDNKFKIFLSTPDCFTIRAKFPKGHTHEGLVADFVMARKEVGVIPGTRKPILELGTLHDDLVRRDFTCNAIAKDLDGNLIDPFDGQSAIQSEMLITPLDPVDTFMDDPLRMIRALRFSITKGFTIAPKVWAAIFVPGLLDKLEEVVSVERIQAEVTKMMKHDTVATLRLLAEIDKIQPRLIEIMFSKGVWLMPTTKTIKNK